MKPTLVKIDKIQNDEFKKMVNDFISFFKDYNIDVKPYFAIRQYPFGTQILSINVDHIFIDTRNNNREIL